jgi:5-methylcytosine-specific restriction endonuclease McrA
MSAIDNTSPWSFPLVLFPKVVVTRVRGGKDGNGDPCSVCLVPMKYHGETGICQRNPECRKAYSAAYEAARRQETPARVAARAVYYDEHKEHIATRHAERSEERAIVFAAWAKANPENGRARGARRRTRAKVGMDRLDRELSVAYRLAIANDPCFYCGAPGEEDEHYTPLSIGGTDHWWNLVRSCASCNRHKYMKSGDEFIVCT